MPYLTDKQNADWCEAMNMWLDSDDVTKDRIIKKTLREGREINKQDILVEYGTQQWYLKTYAEGFKMGIQELHDWMAVNA